MPAPRESMDLAGDPARRVCGGTTPASATLVAATPSRRDRRELLIIQDSPRARALGRSGYGAAAIELVGGSAEGGARREDPQTDWLRKED